MTNTAATWKGYWSLFTNKTDKIAKFREGSIPDLVNDLGAHGTGKDGRKINFACYIEHTGRKKSNIRSLHGLILDFDHGTEMDLQLVDTFPFLTIVHHSYSSNPPDVVKFRVLIPFSKPVTGYDYEILWDWFFQLCQDYRLSEPDRQTRQYAAVYNTVREDQAITEVPINDTDRPVFNPYTLPDGKTLDELRQARKEEEARVEKERAAERKRILSQLEGSPSADARKHYAENALAQVCNLVSQLPPGNRNAALNREAFKIGTLIGAGVLDEATAKVALIQAGQASGHEAEAVKATVDSGMTAGKQNPRDLSTVGYKRDREEAVLEETESQEEEPPIDALRYPRFEVNEHGVYCIKLDKKGQETDPKLICSPLKITAITRDLNSQNWGRLLEFRDRDGNWHKWSMPMEYTATDGTEYRRILLNMGVEIFGGKYTRDILTNYIAGAAPKRRCVCTTKTGWFNGKFVLPDRVIGQDDDNSDHVLFQSMSTGQIFAESGTLDAWKNTVGEMCKGNSRLVFSVCIGLASALLDIMKMDSGGFHFRGGSSTGKSTALRVAASVFGSSHYIRQWRATDNALEAIAAQQNDALLILDEIGQVSPTIVGNIAYMLANGCSKARANRYANGTREMLHWRLFFLSSGEIGLSEHMKSSNQKSQAGMEMRLLEIPADAGAGFGMFENLHDCDSGAEFADRLKVVADENYGVLFPTWLQMLVDNKNGLFELIHESKKQFCDAIRPDGATGQTERALDRFALIAVAGELASEWGLTGWDKLEATQAAAKCFQEWVQMRGTAGSVEEKSILDQIRMFFQLHGASRFQEWRTADTSTCVNRAGFKRTDPSGSTTFLVFGEVFRDEICRGYDSRTAVKILREAGYLDTNTDKGSSVIRLPGFSKSTRCYKINGGIIGEEASYG